MSFINKIITLCVACTMLYGQESPQYSLFDMNLMGHNAAFTGINSCVDVRLGARPQWIGFEDAPMSLFANISGRFRQNPKKKKYTENFNAWGLEIEEDRQGRMGNSSLTFNYAFNLAVNADYRWSFGTKVGFAFYRFSASDLSTYDINDPLLTQSTTQFTFPNLSFGTALYSETSYYSIAFNDLLALRTGRGVEARTRFDFQLSTGHIFNMGTRWQIRPGAQIKWAYKSPLNIQLLAIFMLDKWIGAGLSYRNIDAIGFHLRAQIKDQVYIGYAYEFPMSSIRTGSIQTHELTIGVLTSKVTKKTGLYYHTQF